MSGMNLTRLLDDARPLGEKFKNVNGVVPALVLSIYDSSAQKRHLLGMVQVYFPWLQAMDDPNLIKPWARLCMPAAGRGYPKGKRDSDRGHYDREDESGEDKKGKVWGAGFYSPPSVGDEVLVACEHGDLHHPYVMGTLWNGKNNIPVVNDVTKEFKVADTVGGANNDAGGSSHKPFLDPDMSKREKQGETGGGDSEPRNHIWFWRSRTGHLLIFDDSKKKPKIIITTASGKERFVLDEANHKVQIVSGYFEKKSREPIGGDGANGDQDNGGGDAVDGGDIEILAKNRIWLKARKVNFEVSHNMHIHTGNNWSVFADGKITAQSGGNTSVTCKRAMLVDVKDAFKKPKNAPNAPPGGAQPGEFHMTTDKRYTLQVKDKDMDVKVKNGPMTVTVFKDITVKAQTGKIDVKALKDVSIQSQTAKMTLQAMTGIDIKSIGPIKIQAASLIKETAPLITLN